MRNIDEVSRGHNIQSLAITKTVYRFPADGHLAQKENVLSLLCRHPQHTPIGLLELSLTGKKSTKRPGERDALWSSVFNATGE